MAGKNTAVFGIYPNRTQVDSAVDALKAAQLPQYGYFSTFPRQPRHEGICSREKHQGA